MSSLTEGLDLGLGFDVPIVAFRYWVLGLPAPGSQFVYEPDGFIQRGLADLVFQNNESGSVSLT